MQPFDGESEERGEASGDDEGEEAVYMLKPTLNPKSYFKQASNQLHSFLFNSILRLVDDLRTHHFYSQTSST